MLKKLKSIPELLEVFNILASVSPLEESRLIGGCVRDALLGKDTTDIDIATTILPDVVEQIFLKHKFTVIKVGKTFGTIKVIGKSGLSYEVTTLREDIETDGRHAIVRYTKDWRADASRRDFTFNAMSYSLDDDKLYDYFGGQEDLKNKVVRFIGDPSERVREDYLRILRFFRFYTYYGGALHKDSIDSCKIHASHIHSLSKERIWQEFSKILAHENFASTLKLMLDNDVLAHMFTHEVDIFSEGFVKLSDASKHFGHNASVLFKLFCIATASNVDMSHVVACFKLSNDDKKYLIQMQKAILEKDIYSLTYYYKSVAIDAFIYKALSVPKLSLREEDFNLLKSLQNQDITMPLSGGEIMEIFALEDRREQITKLQKLAERYWIESHFTASKESVVDFIKRTLHP